MQGSSLVAFDPLPHGGGPIQALLQLPRLVRKCGDYGYPGEMKPFLLQLWGFSLLMVLVKVLLSVIEWVFVDEINFLGHSMFFYLDAFPK
eukprot:1218238-Amorphochlora_amoeboformis.AAC.1